MTSSLPHIRYDSRDYPPETRFAVWRQIMSATYDVELLGDAPFAADVDGWMLGDLMLAHSHLPPIGFRRDDAKIKSENSNHYLFFHLIQGHATSVFEDRTVEQTPGNTVVFDMQRRFHGSGEGAFISVSAPRELLEKSSRTLHSHHGAEVDGPLARLVADHLTSTVAIAPHLSAAEAPVVARTTVLLLASCLTERGVKEGAPVLSLAIRHDVQRHIEGNLHRPELAPALICAELGISRASAYRAFEGTEGIAAFIRARRLAAARTMLEHPGEHRPIAEIASAVGFTDPALFSHSYRRAFGHAPREARDAAASAGLSAIEISSKINHANFRRWMRDLDTHLENAGRGNTKT
ncbi:MAG TPA: helix-turn-helix domain-containing protein [Rhizomicrobium sp.]|jgi:AraC-like DNA-binding protein